MKTRQEIEEQLKDTVVVAESAGFYKVVIELLLDMRDMMEEEKQERMMAKIKKARENKEKTREETLDLQMASFLKKIKEADEKE